jgi:hypothetical protein
VSRLRPRERDSVPALDGPAGEVFRLQRLAGNTAVNALMRGLQREEGSAPAPTEERPKPSGITVTVADERIGSFEAMSVSFSNLSATGGGSGGPKKVPNEVVIVRKMDKLSPLFQRRAGSGEPFPSVTIAFPGLPFVMKEVFITSYTMGTGHDPVESMTFTGKDTEEK